MTGRCFSERQKEHKRALLIITLLPPTSAKHLLEKGHNGDFNMTVLHLCDKGDRLNVLETLEITRNSSLNIANEVLFPNPSPILKTIIP